MRGEPVEVWLRDGKPARFVWRGRLYTVLAVLERWATSREWAAEQQSDAAAPAGREFWRVEASPGKNVPSAVYELHHDEADRWLLSRSWD
jgi:Family of unknown function (DUF6504)